MSREFQVITLELSDGRRVSYAGRFQMSENDKVVGIKITEPRVLPDGMFFETLEVKENENKDERTKKDA